MSSSQSPQEPAAVPTTPGLRARLRAVLARLASNRLGLALAAGIATAVSGGILVAVLVMSHGEPIEQRLTVERALEALDAHADAEAGRLAARLEQRGGVTTGEWGAPAFVLGAVAARKAEQALNKDKAEEYAKAARHLEEAWKRGFPEGRESEGLYLLAKSLCLSGRVSAARPAIEAALEAGVEPSSELNAWLADAYLKGEPPQFDKALAANELCLSSADLSDDAHAEALLQRAEIFFHMGRTAECETTLDKLPAGTNLRGRVLLLRGRMFRQEARALQAKDAKIQAAAIREKYRQAMEAFRQAQARDTVSNQAAAPAMYLIGLCQLEMDDPRAAEAQFARVNRQFRETAEGMAAEYQVAVLAHRRGHEGESVAAYRRLLAALGDVKEFHNPWFSLEELRTSIQAARQDALAANKFQAALQISKLLLTLLPEARVIELTADVYRAWGRHLLAGNENLPPIEGRAVRRQARAEFRKAGRLYARVAQLELTTRQYPDRLWQTASAYLEGQDYSNAARVLENYVHNQFRQRNAQALVELGAARLALGQWDKALDALRRCLDYYPRDSAVYRARLLAARAWLEKGDAKQAEALLQENLRGGTLAPASKEWRDSLFTLAKLLHAQGRYEEALRRLDEAVARYPQAPAAVEARYLAADAALRCALAMKEKEKAPPSLDDSQPVAKGTLPSTTAPPPLLPAANEARSAEARALLEQARAGYRAIEETLQGRQELAMTPGEQAMLRNSRFALGEVCRELRDDDAALRAYTAAANYYPNSPEALDAYVQLAGIYRRVGRAAEARASLQQAKAALARMPNDAHFTDTTNYSRAQWGAALTREMEIVN